MTMSRMPFLVISYFFFQAEDGIRDLIVTGVQTCALPIYNAGFTSPITGFMPWGASTYHGMQTQLSRRMANGLQFQAAYTWSHAIDDSTEIGRASCRERV